MHGSQIQYAPVLHPLLFEVFFHDTLGNVDTRTIAPVGMSSSADGQANGTRTVCPRSSKNSFELVLKTALPLGTVIIASCLPFSENDPGLTNS